MSLEVSPRPYAALPHGEAHDIELGEVPPASQLGYNLPADGREYRPLSGDDVRLEGEQGLAVALDEVGVPARVDRSAQACLSEYCCVGLGTALALCGSVGMYVAENKDEALGFGLFFGAVGAGALLLCGLLCCRNRS